jgi:MFS family permease
MIRTSAMTAAELRASFGLASVFGLRMLGMFIILPVFALYAERLPGGSSHTLIGLALGAYGLTQAVLQIPFGRWSDRWTRKGTIYVGLLIFAAGSFVAAAAQDIYMVILGRVIQGAGAISAAVLALAADLTRDEQRTKTMAIIGITIGATFGISMVAGPLLNAAIGVPGLFALTGALALGAIALVRWFVPTASRRAAVPPSKSRTLRELVVDSELGRLNLGIFVLHAVLMALFVVVPFNLRSAGLSDASHWHVYLPVMLGSVALMMPAVLIAERTGRHKAVFLGAIAVLLLAQALLAAFTTQVIMIACALLVFFSAFNLLEANLPALVSKAAPIDAKGEAIGVYSSMQFLGTFAGAAVGGYLSQQFGRSWVFAFCAAMTLVWLIAGARMQVASSTGTRTYTVPRMDAQRADGLSRRLADVPGVREALVIAGDGIAYLKVDSARFDEQSVLDLIAGET